MVKCHFTGKEVHPFQGIHLIKNDGSVEFYSSSKAMKNSLKLKRDKRKLKWTEAYRINRVKIIAKEEKAKDAINNPKVESSQPKVEKPVKKLNFKKSK